MQKRNSLRPLSVLVIVCFASGCRKPHSATVQSMPLDQVGASGAAAKNIRIAAHGQNRNVSPPSTWENMLFSVEKGADILEFDLQLTGRDNEGKASFVISHSPTPHILAKGYTTNPGQIAEFKRNNPSLAERVGQNPLPFLFDRFSSYTIETILRTFWIYDEQTSREVPMIAFEEMLNATKDPAQFVVPSHPWRQGNQHGYTPEKKVQIKRPLLLYLDMKDLNLLARTDSGLSVDDWQRATWSHDKMESFTREVLTTLSRMARKYNAHSRLFFAARHPTIARMAKQIDPDLKIMAADERTKTSPDLEADSVVSAIRDYESFNPHLVELKFLKQALNPTIRSYLKDHSYTLFFNHIRKVDPSQFDGVYSGNPRQLIRDLAQPSDNLVIQTDTVGDIVSAL